MHLNKDTKKPNIAVEVFLSLVNKFLIFVVINNLIWAAIFTHYVYKSFNGTSSAMEVWQDGSNNNNTQSMTNG